MTRSVEVAVIGAGHAGLNAIKEIRKLTDDYVLINGGELGTTCARFGCMPSKVAIHLAETFKQRDRFGRYGIEGGDGLALNQSTALEHVRDLRDTFVDLVLANTTDEMDDRHLLEGFAKFEDANTLTVDGRRIKTAKTIIATGAHSFVPSAWRADYGDGILTVDNLFDLESLPESVAVIGLGPIGIEIGQALHRMGVSVHGFEKGDRIARISDPAVSQATVETLRREFPISIGQAPLIDREEDGFRVRTEQLDARVEKLFVALGRKANIANLQLDRLGLLNEPAELPFNPQTLQIGRLPLYLAGDATGGVASLQRAAEQGRIAGYNAVHSKPAKLREKTPMSIIFTEPNIAFVGTDWDSLDPQKVAVAQRRFGPNGRALIMGQNRGLLRVYANRRDQRLVGASMVGPRVEHLAHLLGWAVEERMTVERALEMPFYHPVIEEALQEALEDLRAELSKPRPVERFVFFRNRKVKQNLV